MRYIDRCRAGSSAGKRLLADRFAGGDRKAGAGEQEERTLTAALSAPRSARPGLAGRPAGDRAAEVGLRTVAATGISARRNLASFGVALLLASLVVLASAALGVLIATSFYGFGGLG